MIISTNAIILKTIPYGDSSVISRLFTKDNGKISIIAKGAWRPKKTAGSMLEPMNHIYIQYYTADVNLGTTSLRYCTVWSPYI